MTKPLLFLIFLFTGPVMAAGPYGFFETTTLTQAKAENIKSATVALVRSEDMIKKPLFKLSEVYHFCKNENFEEQRLFPYCSGTLISEDVILTAAHCIRDRGDCAQINFLFDYRTDSAIEEIRAGNTLVRKCKKILYRSNPNTKGFLKDYALIQMDQKVSDRVPIEILDLPNPISQKITALGHPLGLPQKISVGYISAADSQENQDSKAPFYKARMPTNPGLSGGGVYNENLDLIGVLVRGDSNFESDVRCVRRKSCDLQACPWAHIQRLELRKIRSLLNH